MCSVCFLWHIDGCTGRQTLLAFFLPEDFKFQEEDKVITGTDLVYNSSKRHFEYRRTHEECLIYVENMSGRFNV